MSRHQNQRAAQLRKQRKASLYCLPLWLDLGQMRAAIAAKEKDKFDDETDAFLAANGMDENEDSGAYKNQTAQIGHDYGPGYRANLSI